MRRLKILVDECLDRRLVKELSQHIVKTVPQMGWAGLTNGKLLGEAQRKFDIFLTNDQNLSAQQNLKKYDIAVVVLCPPSSRFEDLKENLRRAVMRLDNLKPGLAVFVK